MKKLYFLKSFALIISLGLLFLINVQISAAMGSSPKKEIKVEDSSDDISEIDSTEYPSENTDSNESTSDDSINYNEDEGATAEPSDEYDEGAESSTDNENATDIY